MVDGFAFVINVVIGTDEFLVFAQLIAFVVELGNTGIVDVQVGVANINIEVAQLLAIFVKGMLVSARIKIKVNVD